MRTNTQQSSSLVGQRGVLTTQRGVIKSARGGFKPIAINGAQAVTATPVVANEARVVAPLVVVPSPVVADHRPVKVVAPANALTGVGTPIWTHEEYHADKTAVSCTVLKKILRSTAHMKAYLDEPNKGTNARLIGTSLHAAVLEPAKFADSYVIWAGGDRRGAKYAKFVADNPGKAILKPEELANIIGMRDAIMNYQEYPIGSILTNGINEGSIVWVDKETGVRCKVRHDCRSKYGNYDLKTTDDSRPQAFVRQCVKLDYDLQAFMYTEGEFQLTGERPDFYFVAVETSAPFAPWVYQASAAMLASGELKFRKALARYAEFLKTGQYPGYEMPASMIEWPKYA